MAVIPHGETSVESHHPEGCDPPGPGCCVIVGIGVNQLLLRTPYRAKVFDVLYYKKEKKEKKR
jgi:hypothetical protein